MRNICWQASLLVESLLALTADSFLSFGLGDYDECDLSSGVSTSVLMVDLTEAKWGEEKLMLSCESYEIGIDLNALSVVVIFLFCFWGLILINFN